MHMSRLYVLLLSLCLCQAIDAQSILSRVTFPLNENQTTKDLAKAGIDLSHGHGRPRISFTTELDSYELEFLRDQGITYTVEIPNLSIFRQQGHHSANRQLLACSDNI